MPSRQSAVVSTVLFFLATASSLGQDVSPSYAYLKSVEPFIGQRQVIRWNDGLGTLDTLEYRPISDGEMQLVATRRNEEVLTVKSERIMDR
ncbi:MAG: hypothetical protein ACYC0X_08520 [Pirellulaceae bacterium]